MLSESHRIKANERIFSYVYDFLYPDYCTIFENLYEYDTNMG